MSARVRRASGAALLVALTLGMVLSARAPAAGEAYRLAFVGCALAAGALVPLLGLLGGWTMRQVLALAFIFRVVVFPMGPSLSDDAYRYVWDGALQAQEGVNPYRYLPSDTALAALHGDPIYARLNSAGYYSVYPPLSQLVFSAGGLLYEGDWRASYYAIKLLVTLVELGGVLLLARLAAPAAVLLYAWHPLAVLEVAGQGHSEGLAVGFLLLVVLALQRGWGAVAGGALAAAAAVKLTPLLLLLFAWRRGGRRVMIGLAVVGGLLALPYSAPYALRNVSESLGLYVRLFEFNAGPYEALKGSAAAFGLGDVSKALGPLLQWFLLLALGLSALKDRRAAGPFAARVSLVYGLFFAAATTVHPWYLLLPLSVAPLLERPRAWLWLAGVAPATSLLYTGPAWAYPAAVAVGWGGFGLLVARDNARPFLDAVLRRRARWKWAWIERHLPPVGRGDLVLDLGAGEGFVGEVAAVRTGAAVTLMDVADDNRTPLTHVTVDGTTLPCADESVDLVLLVFVLHHARDPDAVLGEVRRVSRGRVVVVESTPPERMRWLTEGLDRWANRLRGPALRAQEPWLRMRTDEEWRRRFEGAGLRVVIEASRGRLLHPQTLFVLEPT